MILPNLSPNDWNSLNYIIRLIDERLSEIEGIHGRVDFRQPGTQQDTGTDNTEVVRYDQLLAVTGFVPTTRTLTAGAGLGGGGDLSVDRTFSVNTGDGITIAADAVIVDNGTGLDFDGGGALKLADTAVVAGSYTAADITVDQQGRITSAADGSSEFDRRYALLVGGN